MTLYGGRCDSSSGRSSVPISGRKSSPGISATRVSFGVAATGRVAGESSDRSAQASGSSAAAVADADMDADSPCLAASGRSDGEVVNSSSRSEAKPARVDCEELGRALGSPITNELVLGRHVVVGRVLVGAIWFLVS